MLEQVKFSESEFQQLQFEIESIVKKMSSEKFRAEFSKAPMRFLERNNFEALHKTISNSRYAQRSLTYYINTSFRRKQYFTKCDACKNSVYLLILAILGKAGAAVAGLSGFLRSILNYIKRMFGEGHDLVNLTEGKLRARVESMSPMQLARLVCSDIGYCDANFR
ncbi:MAG: hypothetical protein MK105_06275 [Crocinitomicaceae bacterium]|nr:hypothetical protein [Crocinitomicaceae bacterium]